MFFWYLRNPMVFAKKAFTVLSRNLFELFHGENSYPIGSNYNIHKASLYDQSREKDGYWFAEQNSVSFVLNKYPNLKNVLDAPFGTGRFLELYSQHGLSVCGVDISEDMVSQARIKFPGLMSDVKIHIGDIKDLPLANASVDLVVCYRFLSWIVSFEDADQILAELSRVCRGVAVFEFCVGVHETGSIDLVKKATLWDRKNFEELVDWLSGHSFHVVDTIKLWNDASHPGLTAFICEK